LVQQRDDLQLIPPNTVKLDTRRAINPPIAPAPPPAGRGKNVSVRKPTRPPAWWTARATVGEVVPGFSKAEILKQAPDDPRAPGGVLMKVTELLEELRS
jgi:hypothetical protein